MVMTVHFTGLSITITDCKKYSKNISRVSEKTTRKLAVKFKDLLKAHIIQSTSFSNNRPWYPATHSTPKSLIQYISGPAKKGKSYSVSMKGQLPVWVEYGTAPHPQPNNPYWRNKGQHPGARPKYYFRDAVRMFLVSDARRKIRLIGKEILYGGK